MLSGLRIDAVVDIGANRGQFALCMRRQAHCDIADDQIGVYPAAWRQSGHRYREGIRSDQEVIGVEK